jgi:hypothetical protein
VASGDEAVVARLAAIASAMKMTTESDWAFSIETPVLHHLFLGGQSLGPGF